MKKYYDCCVIGGGFYGCCLALWLRKKKHSVLVLEKEKSLMTRASAINQARVHTGFHYPRSFTTAIRSLINMPRFVLQFRKAIVDDFTMLYAIARKGSKVTAARFLRMYQDMGAPIAEASAREKALFASDMVENVFAVREHAFDHTILCGILEELIAEHGVEICCDCEALRCVPESDGLQLILADGNTVKSRYVFNCTYSRLNLFLQRSGAQMLKLKHELTEMALVSPPAELKELAVTVMDGNFFSIMPYPSRNAYSLSHVRYTPHFEWHDNYGTDCLDPYEILAQNKPESSYIMMERDMRRFMPSVRLDYLSSMYEIKTVLSRNESDDGRPILLRQSPELGKVYSVLGSKLDNVYDLLDAMTDAITFAKD